VTAPAAMRSLHARADGRVADVVALPVGEPDDIELVRRACAGDAWAHEAIYRRYVQRVARVAQRLLREPAEVDDIVQETFLIAFEHIAELAEPAAVRGWLTRIALSRVHRRFRWQRWTRPWSSVELAASFESQVSHAASPDHRAELALIDRALRRVKLEVRIEWTLRRVLGDSLDEVADACSCSLATAKRRIAAADAIVEQHVGGAR
jgi:RNA polymerase sigma-70 factor, ECF subfamily